MYFLCKFLFKKHDNPQCKNTDKCVKPFGKAVAFNTNTNMWVVVGKVACTSIAYSIDDGETWNAAKGPGIFSDVGYGVACNSEGNMWVAVGKGNGGTIAYSTDGITWTGAGTDKEVYNVAFGDNTWFAVGLQNIVWSNNGKDWESISSYPFQSDVNVNSILYNKSISIWIAVGVGFIAWSVNGKDNWITQNFTGDNIISVNCNAESCVAISNGSVYGGTPGSSFYNSTDGGKNWVPNNTVNIDYGYGVYTDDNITIAIGDAITPSTATTPKYVSINYSNDKGATWNIATFTTSILNTTYGIAYNKDKGKFIAVGESDTGNNVLYSDDGKFWNARAQI